MDQIDKYCRLARLTKEVLPRERVTTGHDLAHLVFLKRRAKALADFTATFGDAFDCYILSQIKSLAGPGTTAEKLLSHFDAHLRGITQDVVSSTTDEGSVLREILERCYSESLQRSGTLNLDNYADSLDGACLKSPYDPDFWVKVLQRCHNRPTLFYPQRVIFAI
jgi:hypothetical protein